MAPLSAGFSLDPAALKEAEAAVERVLAQPEALLDTAGVEARGAAKGARSFVKLFFDAAQAGGSTALRDSVAGLQSLVVDGFDHEQIWEELEVQNIPLRRLLRRRVVRLAAAPKGVIDLGAQTLGASAASSSRAGDVPLRAQELVAPAASEEAALQRQRRKKVKDKDDGSEKGVSADEDEEAPVPDHDGAEGELEDGFFKLDEMERFADSAEGKMRLDDDAGDSDFDMLEASEDEEGETGEHEAKEARFADFFAPSAAPAEARSRGKVTKKNRTRLKANEDEEEQEEDGVEDLVGPNEEGEYEEGAMSGGDSDDLSEEEKELEAQIQQLQGQRDEDDDDDESEDEQATVTGRGDEAAEEEDEGNELDTEDGHLRKDKKSLYDMDKRLKSLEDEVAKLEEEQLEDKHWSLRGEVSAKQRPLNSLLEVHLDQPMTQLASREAEDAADAAGLDAAGEDGDDADKAGPIMGFDVESIIRQRIWDEAFDDVVRKTELPPSQRPQGEDDVVENLNFQKSRVGLGDIYAQQYEAEMLGHKTEAEQKEDADKVEAKTLFAKLMFKLDQLTNAHFTPRPPMLGVSGEQLAKVPSLKMEETIPLMVSDASLKAPEEVRAPRRHDKERGELSHDERAAARRAKKTHRRSAMEKKLNTGEMTLAGMRERNKKLAEKNAEVKKEAAEKGKVKEQKKRVKASEMLLQASQNASTAASRKGELRKDKSQRPDGTPASKRLKL